MKKINRKELAIIYQDLARRIIVDGKPTIIVGIRTGGDEVARGIAQLVDCPVLSVHIARPDRTGIYRAIARVSKLLAKIVYEILFLVDYPRLYAADEIPKYADILLVDDAIQSGKTMRFALNWLKDSSPKTVRIAVVTDMSSTPIARYAIRKSLTSFPWSKNNQESGERQV